jgi:heptosyltransferase-1
VKVLIVKVSALGDVVHALPVLDYLLSADASLKIGWVVEESIAPLLDGHPRIHRLHAIRTRHWRDRRHWRQSLGEMRALLKSLRSEGYSVVLDLQGNSKSGFITAATGAPLRYGFDRQSVREWPNLLATNRHVPLTAADQAVTARALRLARTAFPGGSSAAVGRLLFPPPAAEARVAALGERLGLTGRRVVIFHPGTSWVSKMWALDHWRELARRTLTTLDVAILLTWGSASERDVCHAIREACGQGVVVWPRGTLQELVALLMTAAAVVGGDTGPVHLAAAAGTPTLSLFRATDAARNGPQGPMHRQLQAPLGCAPCLRKRCPDDNLCSRSIPVDTVHRALKEILDR